MVPVVMTIPFCLYDHYMYNFSVTQLLLCLAHHWADHTGLLPTIGTIVMRPYSIWSLLIELRKCVSGIEICLELLYY